jgi:hypothetical protein
MRKIFLLALASCLRSTQFHCDTDTACGAAGRCETDVGFCSVQDQTCTSGFRFGDSAGTLAGACVNAGGNIDASMIDSSGSNMGSDAGSGSGSGSGSCPSDYMAVSGGNPNHKYKALASTDWGTAASMCSMANPVGYLAVPDDANELAGIATLGGTGKYWVGIDDIATEGSYVNVKTLMTQTFLPWAGGEPDNNGNQDCVAGKNPTEIETDQCGQSNPAVCECED